MNWKELILQLIQIVIFFAFPTIWAWIIKIFPGWPFPAQDTLNILVFLAVTIVSWLLGFIGVRRLMTALRTRGLAADVTK